MTEPLSKALADRISTLEHAAMAYAQDPQAHTERRLNEARAALTAHQSAPFGEQAPQAPSSTAGEVAGAQSTVAAGSVDVEATMKLVHNYAAACVDFEKASVQESRDRELLAEMKRAEAKLRTHLAAQGTQKAEARVEELEAELDAKQAELDEALHQPWPEWAKQVLKMTRDLSGYDGYDDQDGIDVAEEVREAYAELTSQIERMRKGTPVAWRHNLTHCLYETEEDVRLADGDSWAEPLFLAATPPKAEATQAAAVGEDGSVGSLLRMLGDLTAPSAQEPT